MASSTSSDNRTQLHVERLEPRLVPALIASEVVPLIPPGGPPIAPPPLLQPDEVQAILQRAGAATASNDAIIAVVDRNGRVLGVATESGVDPALLADPMLKAFAIDGALAKARTAAYFSNDTAPLTSRTIRNISQTTMTEREINSNPNITDLNSTVRGPGFVAPIGIANHFPPGIPYTPQVDLFGIEHTNRDSLRNPGPDEIKGTADDVMLASRFNINPAFIPAGQGLFPPESYGFVTGTFPGAQARGIATLPGGVPIYEQINGVITDVGGIGVFFPGKTGYASEENSSMNSNFDPTKPDRSSEAEVIAFAAVGGSSAAGYKVGALGGVALDPKFDIPFGRIDLVGVTLDTIGPGGNQGPENTAKASLQFGFAAGSPAVTLQPVDAALNTTIAGLPAPAGWLVAPHDGVGITADQVRQIIMDGINTANKVRAQIRLPNNERTRMVFAVTDKTGEVLGLFRMPDSTIFSIDVAVAKARNVSYYNDAAQLQLGDQISGIPAGTAFTNRTFRYASLPRFPEGIDDSIPGPFSQLNDPGTDPKTGLNTGAPVPASAFQSVFGRDSFNPSTNFLAQTDPTNKNGIVFFPGSSGVYVNVGGSKVLVGGFGVSGDGVDEDDAVTTGGIGTFDAPQAIRADQFYVAKVRLPYAKFKRNTLG